MEFTIIHTNDIHSNYENLAVLTSIIKKYKDETSLLLDVGDFADFKRIELYGTGGALALELLEQIGYDAACVGNNETFQGKETLTRMATCSRVPFLSCNLTGTDREPLDGVHKNVILERGGLRILVIGASPDLGVFYELDGFEAQDYIVAISEEIERCKGQYDVCILLSHLGIDSDRKIAEEVGGVDIIIGGHFHILMEKPEICNSKIIFTSGQQAENLGFMRLKYDEGKVELLEAFNLPVGNNEPCKNILEIIKANKEKAVMNLSRPLYPLNADLWHDVVEENPITNFLADALRDLLNAELGIINSGVLNGGVRKGMLTEKKLLELCPSPLNPTLCEIQGRDIREALQEALDSSLCLMDGKGPGFRGKYLGRLHVSNTTVEHDGRRILRILVGGWDLQDDRWYKVATSDYVSRGTGYPSLGNCRNEQYRKGFLRDVLRDYLSRAEFMENARQDRWLLHYGG